MNALRAIYRCAKHQDVDPPCLPADNLTLEQKANRIMREQDEAIYIAMRERDQDRLPDGLS